MTDEEAMSNARLIAAAPELLQALKNMQEDGLFLPYYAIKAIEKATGEKA